MISAEILSSEIQSELFSVNDSVKDLAILTAREGVVLLPSTLEKKNDTSSRRDYGIWGEGRATLVGLITLYSWGKDLVDIGYDVSPRYRRQGYASLALRAIANHARDSCHLRTQAHVGFGNVASQGVALRAGFEVTDSIGGVMIFTDQAGL
ncbi:GNAT family N-acetyltransferase [Candidatus Saccharibacteria bacterium]|nr:GNAT family N-acetyltransferase [Candidatus Saccharibacteria bacterium]